MVTPRPIMMGTAALLLFSAPHAYTNSPLSPIVYATPVDALHLVVKVPNQFGQRGEYVGATLRMQSLSGTLIRSQSGQRIEEGLGQRWLGSVQYALPWSRATMLCALVTDLGMKRPEYCHVAIAHSLPLRATIQYGLTQLTGRSTLRQQLSLRWRWSLNNALGRQPASNASEVHALLTQHADLTPYLDAPPANLSPRQTQQQSDSQVTPRTLLVRTSGAEPFTAPAEVATSTRVDRQLVSRATALLEQAPDAALPFGEVTNVSEATSIPPPADTLTFRQTTLEDALSALGVADPRTFIEEYAPSEEETDGYYDAHFRIRSYVVHEHLNNLIDFRGYPERYSIQDPFGAFYQVTRAQQSAQAVLNLARRLEHYAPDLRAIAYPNRELGSLLRAFASLKRSISSFEAAAREVLYEIAHLPNEPRTSRVNETAQALSIQGEDALDLVTIFRAELAARSLHFRGGQHTPSYHARERLEDELAQKLIDRLEVIRAFTFLPERLLLEAADEAKQEAVERRFNDLSDKSPDLLALENAIRNSELLPLPAEVQLLQELRATSVEALRARAQSYLEGLRTTPDVSSELVAQAEFLSTPETLDDTVLALMNRHCLRGEDNTEPMQRIVQEADMAVLAKKAYDQNQQILEFTEQSLQH